MPARACRSFTREFKTEPVRAAERNGNLAHTARDLGITPNVLYRWKRELGGDGPRAFPGNGSPRDEELARLRRENKRLQDELPIVKKALGIVSSPSR
jgi:transposase